MTGSLAVGGYFRSGSFFLCDWLDHVVCWNDKHGVLLRPTYMHKFIGRQGQQSTLGNFWNSAGPLPYS
jgi:hypothetical protein